MKFTGLFADGGWLRTWGALAALICYKLVWWPEALHLFFFVFYFSNTTSHHRVVVHAGTPVERGRVKPIETVKYKALHPV